ncbi:caspase recruitment domain family, member 19 [Pimephales promelas]|uniref:caspase recruitment domain family, member 19 n=1 Tax=Pimephales promelas TaxID=90988 RepID=UPI001955B733|nr:caspase recruitment domain family, member 19 [Pimephales promelas]KAG1949953.1 caspase recruitment domain-containing protein [Pimephales promelas]
MGESFHEQLRIDSQFLKSDRRLDTELVDKLILQLNRIYPQILTDKEASKFRDLDVPTCIRLAELLSNLQEKGEEACREFYRALHLHVEDVYFSLPTRLRLRESGDPVSPIPIPIDRHVLNDHSPFFFLSCFSVAVGAALLYYYGESKQVTGSSSALGLAAMGLSRKVRDVLIWYTEDGK